MKKLILIFGVFLIICVIISFVAEERALSLNNDMVSSVASETKEEYLVKSENGRIVVYKGEILLFRTDTAVNTLPKADQRTLLYGIGVSTKEEMEKILEDYCS